MYRPSHFASGLLGCLVAFNVNLLGARRLHMARVAEIQGRMGAKSDKAASSEEVPHEKHHTKLLGKEHAVNVTLHEAPAHKADTPATLNMSVSARSQEAAVGKSNVSGSSLVSLNASSEVVFQAVSVLQGVPAASLETIQNNPADTLGWSFSCVVLLFFLKVCLCDTVPEEKWNEVCEQHDELTNTYDREVDKLVEHLDSIANDTTVLAELSFQENQRDFQRVMDRMVANPTQPNLDPSRTRLIHQFRGFLLSWLKIVEQCSLDPVKEPRHLCSEVSLRRATNVVEMAQAVGERCKNTPLALIGEDVNGTSRLREMLKLDEFSPMKRERSNRDARCCLFMCRWLKWECGFGIEVNPDEEDGPFPVSLRCGVLKITLFSWSHINAILGFFLGVGLTVMFAVQQKNMQAGASGVAIVLLIYVLCKMDQLDMRHLLSKEIRFLKDKATAVARRRENVLMCFRKMQDLTLLWRYQTMPRLENFMQLLELMRDMSPDTQEQTLIGVVERLEHLHQSMGDLSLWIGEDALPEQVLSHVAAQIDACTKLITKNMRKKKAIPYILHCLHHAVGFLVIRVIACHDLPPRTSGSVYVLVVQGKGGDDETHQFRTRSVQDIVNPRWKTPGGKDYEEFAAPVSPDTRSITMQVLGDKQSDKSENKVARFGFLVANFRQEPGKWIRMREALYDAKTHKPQSQGEIQYEVFFANQVVHLDFLRKEGNPANIDDFLNTV